MRKRVWRLRGLAGDEVRMLHLSILPVLSWCAGSRFLSQHELRAARSAQKVHAHLALVATGHRGDSGLHETHRALMRNVVLTAAGIPRWGSAPLYVGGVGRGMQRALRVGNQTGGCARPSSGATYHADRGIWEDALGRYTPSLLHRRPVERVARSLARSHAR